MDTSLNSALQNFYNLDTNDLELLCRRLAVPSIHAKTLVRQIYKFDVESVKHIPSDLPESLVAFLIDEMNFKLPTIHEAHISKYDQSVKFLVKLDDGQMIESVLMPEKSRLTLCVSSQVGCARACSFCHTGRMGLKRNLTTGEIVGQAILANRWMQTQPDWFASLTQTNRKVTNIVFMGMGEPLDNFDALVKAIHLLIHPNGLAFGPSKISVSTSGHITGLRQFKKLFPQIPIAISLHATNDRLRRQLMPISREWPLQEVLEFIDECVAENRNKNPLIQYTMIAGVNDSVNDAEMLVEFFAGKDLKVNLIPFNTVEPSQFRSPSAETVRAFQNVLHAGGVRSMIRFSKGQDINAACGQLVDKKNN